jgi:putative ABC transport system permease protein
MLKVTLRSFWEHKRRLVLTVLSIVLGISFMSATFVLGDTFDRQFDDLFAIGSEKTDVQVQGPVLFTDPFAGQELRANLPPETLEAVAAVDGVRVAEPHVITAGFGCLNRVLGADGDPIGPTQGPPTLFESWIPDSELSPYSLAEGRGPERDDEMALNVRAADDGGYEVGDTVRVVTQEGIEEYTLVGTVRFGSSPSSGGATSAEFTLAEAQRLADTKGAYTQVIAGAEEGVSQREVTDAVAAALPDDRQVLTGVEAGADLSEDVQEGFKFFTYIIQAFAMIALLVGIFVISNTFSIIVQQRTRELALLRAVGASRRQVLTSVIVEGALVGLLGAAIGLALGILMAQAFFANVAGDLGSSVAISPAAVITSLLIGLVVTFIAALLPAIRATRVPPLAALRDVAIDRAGASKIRIALGILMALWAALNLATVWTGDGTTNDIAPIAFGAMQLLIAAVIVGPVLAGPSVRTGGRLVTKLSGITGRLAVENASRSPKRTSATASALVIGVALVGFISIVGSSAQASITKDVGARLEGDFVVQCAGGPFSGPGGFNPAVSDVVAGTDGVDLTVAQAFAPFELTYEDGEKEESYVTAIDPSSLTGILSPRMVEGEVTDLTDTGVLIDVEMAGEHGVEVGDQVHAVVTGGAALDLEVEGISDDENLLGYFTITRATYFGTALAPVDNFLYATIDDGEDIDEVIERVDAATEEVPGLQVVDRDGFIDSVVDQIAFMLQFITIALGLSVIVALIGVINTLNLSISERVRELGLLRAVGMDREQLKRSIRWEAVIISMLGTLIGVVLAIGLGWALVQALESSGLTVFRIPVVRLVGLLIGGALLGVAAAVFPSRRAAKLPILEAIARE